MSQIKATSYINFILYIALILSPIITIGLGVICYFIMQAIRDIDLYTIIILGVLQIPMSMFLIKRFSLIRDYVITENEVIQNNIALFKRKDIIYIKTHYGFKTEIKYLLDNVEKSIYIIVSKKKLTEIKKLLSIYD